MIDQNYRWYPVYTRSRAEKKAHEELNRKGILSYLPLKKTVKQWSDRKKIVEEPLIKSYLFIILRLQNMGYSININTSIAFVEPL